MAKNDLRNVKQTQFDKAQVLKGSFSELNSALRTVPTNAILRDVFTHFSQTVDGEGKPISVNYYQASVPAIDKLTFVADVSGSLAGTYIKLEEFLTKKIHVFYYVVSGSGTAPGIGDVETPINIATNDPVSVVCISTKSVIDSLEDFKVTAKNLVTNNITLTYFQFGETSAIDIGTTGFSVSREQNGDSREVGSIELTYSTEGHPIYNGSVLTDLSYNPYTASFDVNTHAGDILINLTPINDVNYTVKDITITPTLLTVGLSNKSGRRSIMIQPKGKTIWYGFDNTVTSGNSGTGFKLTSGAFLIIELGEDQELYAVTRSGTAKVSVSEMK